MLLFIARWTPWRLAKWVRYLMLKIMKRLRMSDDGRPLIAAAKHLVEERLLPSGFEIFQDEEFRQLAKFDQLPLAEHDRIFNELIVSAMAMAIWGTGHAEAIVKPEDFHFWRSVHDQLPKQFEYVLREFGADSKNSSLYRDLIRLRYDEYEKLKRDIGTIWSQEEKEFRSLPIVGQEIASWVHVVAIVTADHIRRGKLKREDKLPSYLRWWLFELNEEIGKFIKRL